MIKQINVGSGAMDDMTDEQLVSLENILKEMDRRLAINYIDYKTGLIGLDYTRNIGTEDEWVDENYLEVNVAAESVPCMIWEVVNMVFNRICR